MGVPISFFIKKYNPKQCGIVGIDRYVEGNTMPNKRMHINGKETKVHFYGKNSIHGIVKKK